MDVRPTVPERLLRRLEWQVLRRLDGRLQGLHRTVFYGAGLDFADLRAYTPGDDVRHIDWNVTARLDEPFVRQYTEDRDLTAWLLVDRSGSMRFGPEQRGKDAVTVELAVSLAGLLSRQGNRVGALLYDNRLERLVPPGSGRTHVLRLANDLARDPAAAGEGRGAPPDRTVTDLGRMLDLALAHVRRRSLLFVLSDFISVPGWERPLALLAQRHEVVAVRVVDPLEMDLPDAGVVVVEDAETGEHVLVDTGDPWFRARLAAEVDARERELQASFRRTGVRVHEVSTGDDLADALIEMVRRSREPRR